MNKTLTALSLAAVLMSAGQAQAAEIDVTITNATKNIYFTPLLVAAHSSDIFLFRSGQAASSEIKQMAEGGDIGPLSSLAGNAEAVRGF